VGTEVITLGLQQVGRQVLGAVTVVEAERGAESRSRNTPQRTLGNDVSPARLRLVDGLVEEVIEEQVLEVGVATVRLGDVLEEDRADDAATAPHERDLWLVELPLVLLACVLDEHETLSIRYDLGSVEGLFEVIDELLLVAAESLDRWALKKRGCSGTLRLQAG